MSNMFQLIINNLFNKKLTRKFPFEPERPAFERSRGRLVFDKDTCILCGICMRKCPADAINVERANGKWELNAYRCIICGECVNSCPKKCLSLSNDRRHSTDGKISEEFKVEIPVKPAPKVAPTVTEVPKQA